MTQFSGHETHSSDMAPACAPEIFLTACSEPLQGPLTGPSAERTPHLPLQGPQDMDIHVTLRRAGVVKISRDGTCPLQRDFADSPSARPTLSPPWIRGGQGPFDQ